MLEEYFLFKNSQYEAYSDKAGEQQDRVPPDLMHTISEAGRISSDLSLLAPYMQQ